MSGDYLLDKKPVKIILALIYIALMTLNFLGDLRGFPRLLKGCGIVVVCIAAICWLVSVNISRLKLIGEFCLIYIIPVIGVLTISCIIWVTNTANVDYILSGCSKLFVQSINIFVALAAVYLFGRDGMRITLYAMVIAYAVIIVKAVIGFGIVTFVNDFLLFAGSFGSEQTGVMRYLEVHDLTFAFGFFFIYYLIAHRDEPHRFLCIALSGLCFLIGLKRIAVVGVVLAVVYNYYLEFRKPQYRSKSMRRFTIFLVLFCIFWLFFVRMGWFTTIMNLLGINTMGRNELYGFINQYYELSPTFGGYGLNYVSTMLAGVTTEGIAGTLQIHNDLLRQYMEIGFFGYMLWLIYELALRPRWIEKRFGFESARVYVVLAVYIFFTYLTDNTMYYYHSAFALRFIPAVCAVYGTETKQSGVATAIGGFINGKNPKKSET